MPKKMKNNLFKYFSLLIALFIVFISHSLTYAALSSDQSNPSNPRPPYLNKPVDPNFDGAYLVDWTDVQCAKKYRLEEANNPGFINPVAYVISLASQKQLTKTIPGTYYYRVKAVSAYINITQDSLPKEIFSWLRELFTLTPASASGPCDAVLRLNTDWSNVQSINVNKPTSSIDGIIYDSSTELPLASAIISSPDFGGSTTSDTDGKFSFSFETFFPESGKLNVRINIEKIGFTKAQRTVEVVASRHSAVEPVYLTGLDPVITTIPPEGGTHINSTGEIELVFPPGAVTEPTDVNSTKYQKGKTLPNELPDTSFFTYALNLEAVTSSPNAKGIKQKVTTFQQPITMRVANTLGFAPGTPIPAGTYNEQTKQWEDTGLMGQISADGQWLEFQIDHFSPWDLNLPAVPPPRDQQANVTKNNTQDNVSKDLGCAKKPGNSLVGIKAGVLYIDHELPEIKRLNSNFGLTLSYNSLTAQPSSLLSIETDLDSVTTDIPATTTFKVSIAGKEAQATYQGVDGKVRYAYLFDGKDSQGNYLQTGDYPYSIEMSNDYTNATYWTTSNFGGQPIADTGVLTIEPVPLTRKINGNLPVNNQQDSFFGAGWNLRGLQRLHYSSDGSILLTEGDGSSMVISNKREPLALTANWHGHSSSIIDYQQN
ncbi:MAG: hypothetical protein AB1629_08490, partial [Candidatus Omnitrophota bacterium]